MVTLSQDHLSQLEAATRALLNPLVAPSVDAWRQEVITAVRAAVGGDRVGFILPGSSTLIAHEGFEAEVIRGFEHYVVEPIAHGTAWPDPHVGRFFATYTSVRATTGRAAICYQDVERLIGMPPEKATFHQETLARHAEMNAIHAPIEGPDGGRAEATLVVLFDRKPRENRLGFLQVLYPALQAGLDTLYRLKAHRLALDTLDEALVAFDVDGKELHRNRAFSRLVTAEPEALRLEGELQVLAAGVRRLAFPLAHEGTLLPPHVQRKIQTARGTYSLRGALLPAGAFAPGETFLVSVGAELAPTLPEASTVRERHGLTRREAEVALLVAEGLTNEQVAERLFVSLHTVRHHVEAVLAKLGLPGRAAVAARLLGAG